MTFASDRLYNNIIKPMLGRLATTVKVREIVPHLPCLTLNDREEIEAKREVAGNYNATQVLMDCLRRRENWPEEFITALVACDQHSLASEISNAYDRIRGINSQRPAPSAAAAATSGPAPATVTTAATAAISPPAPAPAHGAAPATAAVTAPPPIPVPAPVTTVTTATIHKAPHATPPLLTPSPEEPPAPPAASAPSQFPPESLPTINTPDSAEAPVSVPAPEAPAPPRPKPAQPAEPSPSVSAPPAVPPAPVFDPKVTPSLQQNTVSFNPGAAPSLDSSSDLTLTAITNPSSAAAASLPTSVITTSPFQHDTPDTSSQHPSVPEESKTPLGVTESSASFKHPIQDTSPLVDVAVITQNISSTFSQRMETAHSVPPVPLNSQAQAASREMAQASPLASHPVVESVEYFSKPGILRGAEPSFASSDDLQISRRPAENTGSSPVQPARPAPGPCSVTSDELQISNATASSAGSSMEQPHTVAPGNRVPNSTPEENSFSEDVSLSENQPVEDTYDSFCQSLQREPGTMVNVVQISEEPSVLNGQPPSMMGNAVHANESHSVLNHNRPTESPPQSLMSESQPSLKIHSITKTTHRYEVNVKSGEEAGASPEPANPAGPVSGLNASSHAEQNEEAYRALFQPQLRPGYIAGAAAVGVAVAFMAWKLKH